MSARILASVIVGSFSLAACMQQGSETASEPETPAAAAAPEASANPCEGMAGRSPTGVPDCIQAERGGFIPEGIEFDNANRRFLTGSLAEGSIYQIGFDGSLTAVVEDPELVSSVGIEVDEPRDRILVSNSDRDVFGGQAKGQAKLGVYSLTTGERIAMVDLGATTGAGADASFFVNDVTVADDGTVYATDTQRNVIYRVDGDYSGSVFYRFAPMEGLGLNGIVYHPDGYLIVVASSGQGMLYKVPIGNPSGASQVRLSEPATGADGLVWAADGTLAVISNSESRVTKLSSTDGWGSATVAGVANFEGQATTGAAVDDDIYVIEPHFNDPGRPVILRVHF